MMQTPSSHEVLATLTDLDLVVAAGHVRRAAELLDSQPNAREVIADLRALLRRIKCLGQPTRAMDRLRRRQRRLIELLIANPAITVTEAARQAGYREATLDNIGRNLLSRPAIRAALQEARRKPSDASN